MSSTFDKKISPLLQEFVPEFLKSDHPKFVKFLKDYYRYLECGQLTISGEVNYVLQETTSTNYILNEKGDENVVLEDSVAKFTVGETIKGLTSNATATVLIDDFDDNQVLYITSQNKFETNEEIQGLTSNARATITQFRANPIQNIQQLLDYADVDNTIYDFLTKFRDSFLEGISETIASGVSKRQLIKTIKDLYTSKGTIDGHKYFFRLLFDEEAEIVFPRDNMLRVSDGFWDTEIVMKVIETGTSNFGNLSNKVITGRTSGATARVTTVTKFTEGGKAFAQLRIADNSITGTFQIGETVLGTDPNNDFDIFAVVQEIVSGVDISRSGQYYEINDPVTVIGGDGFAEMVVADVSKGRIDEIIIDDSGTGYTNGAQLQFDNSDTDGTGAEANVDIVGGSIQLENATSGDNIITDERESIVVNDVGDIEQEDATFENINIVLNRTATPHVDAGDNIIIETPVDPDNFITNHIQIEDDSDGVTNIVLNGTDANSSNANSKILTEDSVVTSAIQTGVLVGEETHTSERFRQSLPVDNDNDFILEDELGNFRLLREESEPEFLILEQDATVDHIVLDGTNANSDDADDNIVQESDGVSRITMEISDSDDVLLFENEQFTQLETATLPTQEQGEITRIRITNEGNGYTKLPTITVSGGTGAKLLAKSTSGVGGVTEVGIRNFGSGYKNDSVYHILEDATVTGEAIPGQKILLENEGEGDAILNEETVRDSVRFNKTVLVKDIVGTFVASEGLTSSQGTIVSFDTGKQTIKINSTHTPEEGDLITTGTASAIVVQCLTADGELTTGATGRTTGNFIGSKGFVSEDTMRIQDSYYYQDFSYVVKIGESINEWRDSIRTATHPAGFAVFGQVTIASLVNAQLTIPTGSEISGYVGDTETFTPELASTLTTLFTSVFGRRLGTTSDGTTLNTAPAIGYQENTSGGGTVLPSGKRELTLSSSVSITMGGATSSSFAPFLVNLAKYGFMQEGFLSDDENVDTYFTIDQFKDVKINEVSVTGGFSDTDEENFDSTTRFFDESRNFIPPSAFTTRINVPPRGELRITKTGMFQTFDMDFRTFDDIRQTFDEDNAGGKTIDTLGQEFLDFSETHKTFDSNSVKFDIGFAGLTNPLDFSQTLYKFDDTLGGDYARFDADFSFSQTANITTTFDASAFRFDATLSDMGLTFDNTAT